MAQATAALAPTMPWSEPSRFAKVDRWARRNPVTALGFAIVLILAVLGALAPLLAPYDPYTLNPAAILEGPSWSHPFGTGLFGEDIFSRALYGIRIDFAI